MVTMPTAVKRKTFMILALVFSLTVALLTIATDAGLRERLGQTYWVLSLAIIGCILLVLAGYTWDRTLMTRLHEMRMRAGGSIRESTVEDDLNGQERVEADEVMGLARQIEHMARSLQNVEASYRSIVEEQPDLICRYKPDGRLTFVNGAYTRFFGRDRQEILGQRLSLQTLGYPRSEGAPLPDSAAFEGVVEDASGRPVSLLWSHRAIKDREGNVLEYQAIGHDISIRKESERALLRAKEAAESADKSKSEFLTIVSHEIRTPINGVIGFAKLLYETPLSSEQREYVDMIRNSSRNLEALINDILDLSRIEAGQLTIDRSPFALRDCVQDILAFFQPQARAAALKLDLRIDPAVPVIVNGDQNRLRQILTNLVDNALKFTESGGITVTLTCIRGEEQPADTPRPVRLFFAVIDTGIGIGTGMLDQLFKPFNQVDASSRRRHSGSGLGLAISKRLCELMGGAISVDSKPGEGSTFRFSLALDYDKGDSRPPMEFRTPAPSPVITPGPIVA